MNYRGLVICCTDDCGENVGGYYCEVYTGEDLDNRIDYFCIHPDELSSNPDVEFWIREYIDGAYEEYAEQGFVQSRAIKQNVHFRAVLSNAEHPDYGVLTVPFPIPDFVYDEIIERLSALEVGSATERDCRVDEISNDWPVLKRLEKVAANIDELDYLAKRLDSFDVGEASQFQAMAVKLGTFDMKDLINLTFCCQGVTVISDFSDLNKVGRDHLMNINGGAMLTSELNRADTRMTALKLILNTEGTVTPYGVVYDNGMELEQLYDGHHFPAYLYEPCLMMVEMRSRFADDDTPGDYLYLPMSQTQLERTMLRAGIESNGDMCLRYMESSMPDEVDVRLDMEHESVSSLNELCAAVSKLSQRDQCKLGAVVQLSEPAYASQIKCLAEQLDLFDFVPKVRTAEEYGRYMVIDSGHYDYDENLMGYIDFEKFGRERMKSEYGEFVDRGYISYHGTRSLDELMSSEQGERMEQSMGVME